MMRHNRLPFGFTLAIGVAASLMGCPNTTLPDDAFVSCTADNDCPTGSSCQAAVGLCANDTAVAQGTPPVLLDVAPIVSPTHAKEGDTITVTIEVDGEVFDAPAIRLVRDATVRTFAPDEAASEPNEGRYVSTYVVAAGDDEGVWDVHYRLVNRLGLVSEGVLGQSVTLDLTAPPEVSLQFDVGSAQSSAQAFASATGAFETGDAAVDGELRSASGDVLAEAPFVLQNGVLSVTVDLAAIGGLAEGQGVVAVTSVVDLAGNRSESRTGTLTIDNTPPVNVAFQFVGETTVSRTASFDATASDAVSPASALTIELTAADDAINDGRWASPRPLGGLEEVTLGGDDGTKSVTARVCDEAGNCADASDSIVLAAVVSSPTLSVAEVANGQVEFGLVDDALSVAGSATPGATLNQTRVLMVDDAGIEPAVELTGLTVDVTLSDTGVFAGSIAGLSTSAVALVDGRSIVLEAIVAFEGRQSSAAESRSASLRIDRTPPQDVAVSFAGGAAATSTTTTQLVLVQVGANEVFLDGDVLDAPTVRQWVPVATNFPVTLVDGDGTKAVTVQFRDRAHNVVTASNSIELTTNVPTSAPTLRSPWPLSAPGTIARVKPNDAVVFGGVVAANTTIVSAAIVGLNALGSEPGNCREVATVALTSTTLSGAGSVGSPCPEAVSVVLEVIVANPAAVQSIPQESWSAPLVLDTTAPQGVSAVLVAPQGAQPGFTNQATVSLQVGATPVAGEPLEVFISGDVTASPTTNVWFAVDFEASAIQTIGVPITTTAQGPKVIQVRFRDALQNETPALNPSIVFDTVRPVPLDATQLLFVEQSVDPFDPAQVGQTTFQASGSAVGHTVVFLDADDLAAGPLVTFPINAGLFSGEVPVATSQRWVAAAIDEAGNMSDPIDAFLPLLSSPTVADPANTLLDGIFLGGQIEFDSGTVGRAPVETAVTAQIAQTTGAVGRQLDLACENGSIQVGVGGQIFVCNNWVFGSGPQSETLRFNVYPNRGTDRVLPLTTVVRVFSAAVGLAPGSGSTSAIALDLDTNPPLIDPVALVINNRAPGQSDELFGSAGAITDAEFASDRLTFSLQGTTPDGGFSQIVSDVVVNADGSFDVIDLGDNAFASLRMFVVDPAGNSVFEAIVSPDLSPPTVAQLLSTPAAQRNGGTVNVTFTVDDANDLLEIPQVTVGGRAAAFSSGSLNTSSGPQAFSYAFVVDDALDSEGVQPVAFTVTDAVGNPRAVLGALNIDFTAPSSTLETPVAGIWNGSPALRGVATDDNSGVDSVVFAIEDQATNLFFDPQTGAMTSPTRIEVLAAGSTSWTFSDAIAFVDGRTYSLTYQAVDAAGNQEALKTFAFTYDDTAVDAPSGLVAQSGDEAHVVLSWNPVATATSYFVYYGTIGGTFDGRSDEAGDSPIEIPAPASSVDLVGIPRGRYAFAVTAAQSGQQSPFSNVDEAASRWWEWKSPRLGVDSVVASAVLSPGVSLFVGSGGSIRRFVNGAVTLVPSTTANNLTALAHSGGTVMLGGDGVLLRSTDAGVSFTDVTPASNVLPVGSVVTDIASNGSGTWVACDDRGEIYRSTNDGTTWTKVVSGPGALYAVAFSGANVVAAGHSGRLWVSTNSGASFTEQTSGAEVFNAAYGDGAVFVVVGNGGAIHRSANVATTPFAPIAVPPTSDQLLSIAAAPAGLVVGSGRDIYLSTDLGASFTLVHDSVQGAFAFSVSGTKVVAVGSPGGTGTDLDVALSNDGGQSWTNLESGAVTQLSTVTLDGERIITMGYNGAYAQSPNGGLDWEGDGRLTGGQVTAVYVDGDVVLVGGRNTDNQAPAFVARSGDAGESFTVVDPGVTDTIECIHGTSGTIALATRSSTNGGSRAGILMSDDSGVTFSAASFLNAGGSVTVAPDLEEVWVTAGAIVAGGATGIFSSTDGGATFVPASINPTPRVRGIWGRDLEFVVVGESGLLATTLDGGATWQTAPATPTRHYRAVYGDGVDVVAVASNGTDPNGSNAGFISRRLSPTAWDLVASPNVRLEAVWGEAGTFVVGGTNAIFRSTNGGQSFGGVLNLPSTIVGKLDGDAGFVVGTNISNFPASIARVSFDDGQGFLTPSRTANGALGGSALNVAVDDGVAVIVGGSGTVGVFGPR